MGELDKDVVVSKMEVFLQYVYNFTHRANYILLF